MGLSIERYLLACVAEGHSVLRERHMPPVATLGVPAYLRRGVPLTTTALL